jgi:hypothetical protein
MGTSGDQDHAPTGAPAFHKRKVRNYLINRRLQLRLASWLLAVAAIISVVLGAVIMDSYRAQSKLVASQMILAGDESEAEGAAPTSERAAAKAMSSLLASADRRQMLWLGAGIGVVLVVLLGFSIILTHRIAGPAFIIAKTCRQVGEGNLSRPRPLRERDLLVELGDDVVHMVDSVRAREKDEGDRIAAATKRLADPAAGDAERRKALEDLDRLAVEKAKRLET